MCKSDSLLVALLLAGQRAAMMSPSRHIIAAATLQGPSLLARHVEHPRRPITQTLAVLACGRVQRRCSADHGPCTRKHNSSARGWEASEGRDRRHDQDSCKSDPCHHAIRGRRKGLQNGHWGASGIDEAWFLVFVRPDCRLPRLMAISSRQCSNGPNASPRPARASPHRHAAVACAFPSIILLVEYRS